MSVDCYSVVKEVIGPIDPVGDGPEDEKRFENLKNFCHLVEQLTEDLDTVEHQCKDSHLGSVKKAGKYVEKFLNGMDRT